MAGPPAYLYPITTEPAALPAKTCKCRGSCADPDSPCVHRTTTRRSSLQAPATTPTPFATESPRFAPGALRPVLHGTAGARPPPIPAFDSSPADPSGSAQQPLVEAVGSAGSRSPPKWLPSPP